MSTLHISTRLAFGVYEADLATGELWREGYRVKLQSQPFKVLAMLLERPGELVTREELQDRLRGSDTAGDFEHALSTAIKKIREALRDSADNPRFVETLSRRGYRFIAPVAVLSERPAPASEASDRAESGELVKIVEPALTNQVVVAPEPVSVQTVAALPQPTPKGLLDARRLLYMGGALVLIGLGVSAGLILPRGPGSLEMPRIQQLTHSGHFAVTLDVTERLTSAVTDGYRIILPVLDRGSANLASLVATGGAFTLLNIPQEISAPTLGDISPDGSRLLMREHLSPESEQPLWVVPTAGGSAFRVGEVLAQDATFMPDGKGILYAAGDTLFLTQVTGDKPQVYAVAPGRVFWLRWNPAGTFLRFTIIDPISHTESLWQLGAVDRKPVRLLDTFSDPHMECCGVWTGDGKNFVFQAEKSGNWDLWQLPGETTAHPVRITNGPLQFTTPMTSRTGDKLYFLGVDSGSELARLGNDSQLVPQRDFLAAASRLEYSRDKKWVAWVDQQGRLWRAAADGREQIQLTPDELNVFLARWSPDGSKLALMAHEPGQVWRIYLISAGGGTLQPLLQPDHNAADPSWSPDGRSLVFGRTNDTFGKENSDRAISLLDLSTGQVTQISGSSGLFSPRWSPDGKYIAALTLNQRAERLYNVATQTWTTLSERSGADPVWSSDSRYFYFHEILDPAHSIDRVSVADGKVETLTKLSDRSTNNPVDYTFAGLDAGDHPMILSRTTAANIYSLRLK